MTNDRGRRHRRVAPVAAPVVPFLGVAGAHVLGVRRNSALARPPSFPVKINHGRSFRAFLSERKCGIYRG